jgi:hypothetical protein
VLVAVELEVLVLDKDIRGEYDTLAEELSGTDCSASII